MKKYIIGTLAFCLVVSALIFYSTSAFANDDRSVADRDNHGNNGIYDPNKELSQSMCGTHLGRPVIDVTQKVQNDADSGYAGNYWAFDYYTRHIKVWQTSTTPDVNGNNTYCAILTYDGKFYTVPGQEGPGGTGALITTSTDQPVNGGMSGGRRATIVGTFLTTPAWSTHGSVGTTNYQCTITDVCPGLVTWQAQYFKTGYTYNDLWWGWRYTAGSHGTWIDAIDVPQASSGNIL